MRWRGIEGRMLLIVALSSLAMVVASVAALGALNRIGRAAEEVTERDLPEVTAALELARIGERLQSRGASLMVAGSQWATLAAQAAIDADLAAFTAQAEALHAVRPDVQRIPAEAQDLAAELARLRAQLDNRRALGAGQELARRRMFEDINQLRQLIGPSILAIEAITSGNALAEPGTWRTAVRSQAPLLAVERLTNLATAAILRAGGADAYGLAQIRAGYARSVAQLETQVAALPQGLRAGAEAAARSFAEQLSPGGLFDLRARELAAQAGAQTALTGVGNRAATLKRMVDAGAIEAGQRMASVTQGLRQTILARSSQFAAVGLTVILLAALASYLLVIRPLGRNLAGVTTAMTRLAAGERDAQVPGAERRDEIGDLARAFTVFKDNSVHMEQLDRQLAERSNLLLTTFETMKDGFSVFDEHRRLRAFNPQYAALYGFDAADLVNRPSLERINRQLRVQGVRAFLPGGEELPLDRVSQRRMTQAYRHELRFPGGRVIELRSTPNPRGGFATIHMDVSEQRNTESQLLQAQKMESVGLLTGEIAHDFNNILAVILGNLNILAREETVPEPLKGRVRRAQGAAERAAGLVSRLLTFARRQRLAPENVDVNALALGMADLLETSLGSGVRLRMDLAEGLAKLRVDPGQLEAALMNLAVNARDAMGGQGEITIATRPAGEMVALSVSDTGPGIPEALAAQVFEPFFTTKPVGKGSGLGLSMVYGFARQSGGSVQIESAAGACITLHLPVSKLGDTPTPVFADLPHDACILAVDDDADLLEVTAEQLRRLGYAVVTARGGPEALELLEEIPEIDLLYSDVSMPGGMSGGELAQAARRMRPDLAVLYTSGGAAAGLSPLLRKPVSEELLASSVRRVLEDQSRVTSVSNT
ncbi:PAS-domain containing protein [Citreicella sp. C3M06]|uniref:ATP-binding protein n=1 Tax=Citreicella sp. C3M06 TaxID=2841564 RepID=UPI001C0A3D20|nr:ATP-binding protein [Citreicella sp. C3M06]MBU2962721.1 PAS-domain containing protein [Citreicella sp. C3M06]